MSEGRKDIKRGIVWFRQDLRLHDNEALTEALTHCDEIIPVYVFDERLFFSASTAYGIPKTGPHRARFIIESVQDLQSRFAEFDQSLLVRIGKPEEEIFKIARTYRSSWVFCNRERTEEEVVVQDALEKKLWTIGQEMRFSRGKMLYYTQDFPWPVTHTPDIFTSFRKDIENVVPVREPLPVPETIPGGHHHLEAGEIPSLSDLGLEEIPHDDRAVLPFNGGETAGLDRLHTYLWETDAAQTYYETRNDLLGANYSTKFSPWLSQGCLSPKQIYHTLEAYEAERGANKSTYWIKFELLWRDFFRLMGKKYGNLIFQPGGISGEPDPAWQEDPTLFKIWKEGRTGVPIVDANMKEINATGFMSNRGRQLVASFLIHDLSIHWLMGAAYFESMLVDYDPCSNYGNWMYIAGVGNEPRSDRYFNIYSQAKRYDPKGEYVKTWLPVLKSLPADLIHLPDQAGAEVLRKYGVTLGDEYPKSLISAEKWV